MTSVQVRQQLVRDQVIGNNLTFDLACTLLGYRDSIPHGLFQVQDGWSNWTLINHLKTTPRPAVTVVIKPFQKRRNTLQYLCKTLDIKYTALKSWMENPAYIGQWGDFNQDNVYCILIPDTLLIYQDSRARELADRLFRNFRIFWTPERLEQAASNGLTKQETGILASIVYAETKRPEEMPVIAGLYLNRIKQEMRLQADPTVVFAYGRPLTRVLKAHKKIESPYNTYQVSGLPPGPVNSATTTAIEAVLRPKSHNYLYFCARRDFSGQHHFSRTLKEHLTVARKYQKELNKRRIGYKGS
ncbi:MAG: aminodeoxychorismate lyase [Cyclobacteriaceae bacterium]|nr:MAG: aminodeoxychorismate lyase [Cyclobacteriaceae bacterium]